MVTILAVTDSPKILKLLDTISCGFYSIIETESALAALEQVRHHKVDVVIAPSVMTQMDLVEFVMNLKDLGVPAPVIIIDNRDEHSGRQPGLSELFGYCLPVETKVSVTDISEALQDVHKPVS